LYKENFLWLSIILFIYNLLVLIVFDLILVSFLISKIESIGSLENLKNFNIWLFLSDPTVILIISVWLFIFILYSLFYIVIFLWILNSIKQSLSSEKVNIIKNYKYWFSSFFRSMKTYWYIFAYVYLIPTLIFIIGWILLILWLYNDIDILLKIWILILIFWLILSIIFIIYRWTKASFGLYSAVDSDTFDKSNFINSVYISGNIWWRVFWNIFLVWLIISSWTSIIESTIWLTLFGISGWWSAFVEWIKTALSSTNTELIITAVTEHIENSSFFFNIISNLLSIILNTIWTVFSIIFIYLFYLRLFREREFNKNNKVDLNSDHINVINNI